MFEREFWPAPIKDRELEHKALPIDPTIWARRQAAGIPVEYEGGRSIHFPEPDITPDSSYRRTPLILGTVQDIGAYAGDEWTHYGPCSMKSGNDDYTHKGLHSLVRLTDRPRIYVIDNHNLALFAWTEALKEGLIRPGAYLIHVDDHSDSDAWEIVLKGMYSEPFDINNLSMMADFSGTLLEVQQFIEPAIRAGLVREGSLWVAPPTHKEESFGWHGRRQSWGSRHYNSFGNLKTKLTGHAVSEILKNPPDPRDFVLDIDLDYFVPIKDDVFLVAYHLQLLKMLIPLAGCVTIASSPGYMDQEWAVELAHRLLA